MEEGSARRLVDRAAGRTNLFVLAVLRSSSQSVPVRVRNVSENGMLVEAAILPPVGTAVEIKRGALSATGTVIWAGDGRAGLKLSSTIDVRSWLPQKGGSGQSRVDEIAEQVRAGAGREQEAGRILPGTGSEGALAALAAEVAAIAQSLAEDGQMIASCADALQRLDLVAQKLRSLGCNQAKSDEKSTY